MNPSDTVSIIQYLFARYLQKKDTISARIFKETLFLFFLLPPCSTSWKANKKILHLLHSSEEDLCAFILGMFGDPEGDESS